VLVQVSDHTPADERPLGEPVLRTSQPGHRPRIRCRTAPPSQESSDEVLRLDHVLGLGPGDPDERARAVADEQRGNHLGLSLPTGPDRLYAIVIRPGLAWFALNAASSDS